jgi:hypothetical protein
MDAQYELVTDVVAGVVRAFGERAYVVPLKSPVPQQTVHPGIFPERNPVSLREAQGTDR